MTLKGGTSQACARCKYQRRKCTPECALAPYFPPDQPKIFQNAHRLFGVSNILKILKGLDPNQKMEAMNSIIYQANIRDKFPVHGCLGVIMQYQYQIGQVEEELNVIHAQLALYRQHEMLSTANETSQLQLGMTPASNELTLFHQETTHHYTPVSALLISSHPSYSYSGNANLSPAEGYMDSKEETTHPYTPVSALPISSHPSYSYSGNANLSPEGYMDSEEEATHHYTPVSTLPISSHPSYSYSGNANLSPESYIDYKDNNNNVVNSFWIQQLCNNDNNQIAIQASQPLTIQQGVVQGYELFDDRQSYIDSKQAYESSSESCLKDTTQSLEHEDELKSAAACFSLAENELKGAAACFSLTSVD